MEIKETQQADVMVFTLNGRLDSNTSTSLEKRVTDAIENGARRVVIDFEGLDYISSAGLRIILKASKELKRDQGDIALCAMQDYVKEVFEIAGFDTFLTITPTLEAALERVGRPTE
jgi:anti-sigma B factor antagonist